MPTAERGFGRGCRAFWVWGKRRLHFPFRFGWDLQVTGPPPPPGAKVVAANHYSHLDVLLISKAIGPLRYLTLDHLFRGAVARGQSRSGSLRPYFWIFLSRAGREIPRISQLLPLCPRVC